MISPYSPYRPFDYPRVCDICGVPKRRSELHRQGEYLVCSDHPGERTVTELSKAIARQRQFRILSVRDPKPQDRTGPDVLEADEAVVLNFISEQVTAGLRYRDVTSGQGATLSAPSQDDKILTMTYAGRYLSALILEDKRPTRMLDQAETALATAVDYLLMTQIGGPLSPGETKSNNVYFGSLVDGSSIVPTEHVMVGGLAMLGAYRVFGDAKYIASARRCASYLRNVQAIGSHLATAYTSSDAAGTARLYTGGLVSECDSSSGDLVSNHAFYPSSLLALEFWSSLLSVDGDQLVGADSDVSSLFASAPEQLLSSCIADLRAFWRDGTYDVASGNTFSGFSATTPREFFNAYPATKPGFSLTGTGSWEYQDGNASTGTAISSQNFAKAIGALYAVEGATSAVTSVSDWLRGFSSNSTYETADNTSASVLARSVTGTYDPAITLSTLLTVVSAVNGSSYYDWGALGLLAPLWATRNGSSFKDARLAPLGRWRRYSDGLPSDYVFDNITLRGRSGLSNQTAFTETIYSASRMVNDAVTAAQFGMVFRQQPQVMPVQA